MITLYMRGGLVYAWRNVTFSGSTHKVRNNLVMMGELVGHLKYPLHSMQKHLLFTKTDTPMPQGPRNMFIYKISG